MATVRGTRILGVPGLLTVLWKKYPRNRISCPAGTAKPVLKPDHARLIDKQYTILLWVRDDIPRENAPDHTPPPPERHLAFCQSLQLNYPALRPNLECSAVPAGISNILWPKSTVPNLYAPGGPNPKSSHGPQVHLIRHWMNGCAWVTTYSSLLN